MGASIRRVLIWTTLFTGFGLGLLALIRYRKGGISPVAGSTGLKNLFKTETGKAPEGDIEILSLKRIGQGQMLISVRWQGRNILIGTTAKKMEVLTRYIPEEDE